MDQLIKTLHEKQLYRPRPQKELNKMLTREGDTLKVAGPLNIDSVSAHVARAPACSKG